MQLLNPEKASRFLDTVQGERARSAVLAIHLAWLESSSPLAHSERIEAKTPLDLLILYQAVAATFQNEVPPPMSEEELPLGGRILNRQQAAERLAHLADEETRLLAKTFARHVIALSSAAASEQDLDYHVELFLECIRDKSVIDNITSGAISKSSDRLSASDLW
ncbi:MAG TPA: hypothetical protein VN688_17720 [Gemmataceae bacterium]|nr:hypothetical protein [Gemmataceae bacterium]